MGAFPLDVPVKIGYSIFMFGDFISLILRITLIVALWAFVWRLLEPRTQLMRILRAAVLLLGLLGVLVVLRMTGRWLSLVWRGGLLTPVIPAKAVIHFILSFWAQRRISKIYLGFLLPNKKRLRKKACVRKGEPLFSCKPKKPQPIFDINIVTWVKIRFVSRQ